MDTMTGVAVVIAAVVGVLAGFGLGYVLYRAAESRAEAAEGQKVAALMELTRQHLDERSRRASEYQESLRALLAAQAETYGKYSAFVDEVGRRLLPPPSSDPGTDPISVSEADSAALAALRGRSDDQGVKVPRPRLSKSARDGR